METLLAATMWLCCAQVPAQVLGQPKVAKEIGFICQPAFAIDHEIRGPIRPYRPQAGDMFMSTDKMPIIQWGHRMAGANAPHHSGIILCKGDGSYWTLEAGPHNCLKIKALDLDFSLSSYESAGNQVWVRCRKTPLTPEQCGKLNEFGLAQDGKAFALGRMLGQMTSLRTRNQLNGTSSDVGAPHGHRNSYFCAELVTECCVAAGLLDARRAKPCCTYPCDLFYGVSPNPYVNASLDFNSAWEPPARWNKMVPQLTTPQVTHQAMPQGAPQVTPAPQVVPQAVPPAKK
jgi:hypothetical protein